VQSAVAAVKQLELDVVYVIPTGVPPHKPLPEGTPPAGVRHIMTLSAFRGVEKTIVSDIEVKNTKPSYTADTVMMIRQGYPDDEIILLVGTDMFLTIESWRDCEKLLKHVTPAVFSRSPYDSEKIRDHSQTIWERYGVATRIVTNDVVQISSSKLREMLIKRDGVRYITDTNYSYIIKNRLYGAKADWDWLRERAYSMLNPDRIPHVSGCEQEALRLAPRWDVDIDDAREAAILHDITKRLGLREHLQILEDCGITVGEMGFAGEKLLHAISGAALAKSAFGVSDAVAEAIRWHTTGRAGMSMLEKVVYIADFIEPERAFPMVGELRKLAYEDIDKAMIMGLELTISHIKTRGITPDRATLDALLDLS